MKKVSISHGFFFLNSTLCIESENEIGCRIKASITYSYLNPFNQTWNKKILFSEKKKKKHLSFPYETKEESFCLTLSQNFL